MEERRTDAELLSAIRENVEKVIVAKGEVIDLVLTALLCGGHILIEDVPGLGKTTLVSALAKTLDCSFQRIQFTPDVLPSDVTGFTMFNMKTGEKETHFGGIMSQIVLADEINRTSPKTQSSLLEVMQEGQVTIDGVTYPVPRPFMVLATQNPVELTGTYPLPEAQLDRFLMKISVGYPSREEELSILARNRAESPLKGLRPVATAQDILDLQERARKVTCTQPILEYVVSIAEQTRRHEFITLGVSPRGSIALLSASMAYALLRGRDFVLPDDVQRLTVPVLAHRLVLSAQAGFKNKTPESVLRELLGALPVPAVK